MNKIDLASELFYLQWAIIDGEDLVRRLKVELAQAERDLIDIKASLREVKRKLDPANKKYYDFVNKTKRCKLKRNKTND